MDSKVIKCETCNMFIIVKEEEYTDLDSDEG